MACRVGITTNPKRRKKEWEEKHPNLYNWEELRRVSSKSEAQGIETAVAEKCGCKSSPGGAGEEYGDWVVYKFEY